MNMIDGKTPPAPPALQAQHCTAYRLGAFGYKRVELREIETRVAPYAQHSAALHVTWIEKGKRTQRGFVATGRGVALVVLAGYSHPEPYDWQNRPERVESHGGLTVTTSVTRWPSFDPQWAHEFDRQMRDYLSGMGPALLADYRGFDPRCVERTEELRARGGAGPFENGDRVITPSGAGLVIYRRMSPPDFSAAAAYSVKLDGRDHAGSIFPANQVRWEGVTP
jgi:hypothetical protein